MKASVRLGITSLILALAVLVCSPARGAEEDSADEAQIRLQVIGGAAVNVFAGPGVGYPIVRVVKSGDLLVPCGRQYGWSKVCFEDGRQGYVFGRWVRRVKIETEPRVEDLVRTEPERELIPPPGSADRGESVPVLEEMEEEAGDGHARGGREPKKILPEKPWSEVPEPVLGEPELVVPEEEDAAEPESAEESPAAEAEPTEEQMELVSRIPLEDMDLLRLSWTLKYDPKPARRLQAVKVLGTRGLSGVPILLDALEEGPTLLRVEAARQLGNVGGPLAQQGLVDALQRGNTPTPAKIAVAQTLADMGDRSVLPVLRSQLSRAVHEGYREALIQAISKLGKEED